jgi:hypothetical protein
MSRLVTQMTHTSLFVSHTLGTPRQSSAYGHSARNTVTRTPAHTYARAQHITALSVHNGVHQEVYKVQHNLAPIFHPEYLTAQAPYLSSPTDDSPPPTPALQQGLGPGTCWPKPR